MENSKTAYLSLGSNLGNKYKNLQQALFAIDRYVGSITKISNVYETQAWGFESDDFYNICISVSTLLSPIELLNQILQIGCMKKPLIW